MKGLNGAQETRLSKDIQKHGRNYNENDFWKKLQGLPKSAVGQVMEKALLLRELLLDGATPLWARGSIIGVLGYLIMPIDLVPDLLPGVGFVDDLAAMGIVLASIENLITEEIRERAYKRLPLCLRSKEAEAGT